MKKLRLVGVLGMTMMLVTGCSEYTPQEPKVVFEEKPVEPIKVSLSITGDNLLEDPLYPWLGENYDFKDYFDDVKPYLKGDLVIGNQEVLIGGEELGVTGIDYMFNSPKEIAKEMKEVGFDVLTFANNHAFDRGEAGIINTLENLKEEGIATTGSCMVAEDCRKPLIVERKGVKFAILAYTYDTNQWIDDDHAFMVNKFLNANHDLDEDHKALLKQDVERAKKEADVVITAMHWGTEFTYDIDEIQTETASYLNELGVDIIIGNHPHCLQSVDTLKNKNDHETFVIYSLGNFISAAINVDRATEQFTNMYEVGGIINLDVVYDPNDKKVSIENQKLTPFINQFTKGYQNFHLIPFHEYTEKDAKRHYQRSVSAQFTKAMIEENLKELFDGKMEWQ